MLQVISVVSKHVIDTRATLDQQFNIFMNNAVQVHNKSNNKGNLFDILMKITIYSNVNVFYQTAVFRVRPIIPCVITNITFQVEIPDDDEIQVS